MSAHLATRSARRLLALASVATAATIAGCAASPTTTVVDADGDEKTLNWREYPADAYTDAESVLALPAEEDVAEHWLELRAALTRAIEAELGERAGDLEWTAHGEDGWYPYGGNGYGGESLLRVYNSVSWEAEVELPPDVWDDVLDAAERELGEWGIGHAESAASHEDSEHSHWMQSVDFFETGEFMTVTVQDARRDDEAHADAEENGWLVSGISLFYGIQTISAADRAEFERRAAPFQGFARPEPTHSD